MKRSTLSKLALTLVAAFVFVGANAQTNTGSTQWGHADQGTVGDYTRSSATPITDPTNALITTPTDKVTIGAKMPFWVWPSALYNPNFDYSAIVTANTEASIIAGVTSTFAWKYAGTVADLADATADATYTKNYVEITMPATAGNYVIQAVETPKVNICPADAVYFAVKVIDQPMMRFSAAGATQLSIDNVVAIGCEGSTAIQAANTALLVTLDNGDETAIGSNPYHVNMTYSVQNYNIDGASGNLDLTSAVTVASPTLKFFGDDATNAPSETNPVIATSTTLVTGENYTVENNKATVYTYTLVGWNAGISRKSDYIAYRDAGAGANYGTYRYYTRNIVANPVLTNRIVVLPKPVTGPIYHIANDFSF